MALVSWLALQAPHCAKHLTALLRLPFNCPMWLHQTLRPSRHMQSTSVRPVCVSSGTARARCPVTWIAVPGPAVAPATMASSSSQVAPAPLSIQQFPVVAFSVKFWPALLDLQDLEDLRARPVNMDQLVRLEKQVPADHQVRPVHLDQQARPVHEARPVYVERQGLLDLLDLLDPKLMHSIKETRKQTPFI